MSQSELISLRFQLNSHFLFNALNSIYSLSLNEPGKTPDAILKLSETLRYVSQSTEEKVHINEEIDHLKRMLEFEKIRFPFSVIKFDVEIASEAKDLLIEPLLLSPFLENVFKHGDPGTTERPVSVSLRTTTTELNYSVSNPVNKTPGQIVILSGTGLKNLKRRLELLYPKKFVLEAAENNGIHYSHLKIFFNH
jgi:LytS/YehU family sensor histidine kinase